MLFQIKSYLHFLLRSTNEHGVHSPFVFDLVTKCFYDKKKYGAYDVLPNYRQSLKDDKSEIEVTDFGAGSRVFKSNKRKVCDIAKNAGISAKRARMLFRVAHYFQPQNVLEIGTSLGIATSAISTGNPAAKVTTLEGCPQTGAIAWKMFRQFNFANVSLKTAEFDVFLSAENLISKKYDLIYFDGNHTKKATLDYFDKLLPTITNNSCWIFDDIHWSAEMEQAWEEIKKNPHVTVTIDTFQWGFVFFRKEQKKEDFVIRC